jgi:quinate dehydrogenase
MTAVDEVTPQAAAIGSCNTTFFRTDSATGKITHVGTNLDTAGVGNSLLTILTGHSTPFPTKTPLSFAPGTASALMIGGGGATRAAIYAMHAIGLSPIYLVNRDPEETASIVEQFKDWDLRPLETVEQAREALAEGDKAGVRLAAGVGAIPSIEPATEAEKRVYEIDKVLFEHPYDASGAHTAQEFLSLPSKPVLYVFLSRLKETDQPLTLVDSPAAWRWPIIRP